MRSFLILLVSLNILNGVSFIAAQNDYASATLNERRAALFSASRSKMFSPSENWADARTTVSARAGSSDAGSGQMLETMGESSTLETIRANPMNMFLTIGGRMQGLMALGTQDDAEIIDSREGVELSELATNDVNAGRIATTINTTGMYSPRFVKLEPEDLQIQFNNEQPLESDIVKRENELSDRLNGKFNLTGETKIKLTIIQGVAFLQGTVDSKDQRKIAEIFVGFEPGINEVRNELKIAAH